MGPNFEAKQFGFVFIFGKIFEKECLKKIVFL
jgi:hypothetical protein